MGTIGAYVQVRQEHIEGAPDLSSELTQDFPEKRTSVLCSVNTQPSKRDSGGRDEGMKDPGRGSRKKKEQEARESRGLPGTESSSARPVYGGGERLTTKPGSSPERRI